MVESQAGELDVEGALRLRPGSVIDVIDVHDGRARAATVMTWAVTRLGSEGTVYRGRCRWLEPLG